MACALNLCNQASCHCGTVVRSRKCPEHGHYLRVETVPFYDSRHDEGLPLIEREKAAKRLETQKTCIPRWWNVLACPVPGCCYTKPWKHGPKNKKRV